MGTAATVGGTVLPCGCAQGPSLDGIALWEEGLQGGQPAPHQYITLGTKGEAEPGCGIGLLCP